MHFSFFQDLSFLKDNWNRYVYFFQKIPFLKNAYLIVKRDRCTSAVMQSSSMINIYENSIATIFFIPGAIYELVLRL